jgi:RHS repeat-associated protein
MIGFKYNEAYYFYRRNLMGDVTHIYNEVGTLFAEYVYDAWGNYRIKTDIDGIGTLNPIRYRGYYYDAETGLYYLRARYYDPETGRFISDGESNLNETSYNDRYLNRWERLDYTKSQMKKANLEYSKYNFDAWMYYNEYSFHAHVWRWFGRFFENSNNESIRKLAGKAKTADVDAGDPFSDWNNTKLKWWERFLRMLAYFAEGFLGI